MPPNVQVEQGSSELGQPSSTWPVSLQPLDWALGLAPEMSCPCPWDSLSSRGDIGGAAPLLRTYSGHRGGGQKHQSDTVARREMFL